MTTCQIKLNVLTVIIASLAGMSVTTAATELAVKDISYKMTSTTSEEKFEETTLLKSRNILADEQNTELTEVSHGLRKKAIFGLVPVRVYVTQLLAAKPNKLVKNDAGFLTSLKEAGPVQLYMTFLRDLPGQKVADSFKEGLEANKINPKKLSPELTAVMNEVAGIQEFKKGQSFSITAFWKDNQPTLLLEDGQQIKVISGSGQFIEQIFSIWFGKPADLKLAELKKVLLR